MRCVSAVGCCSAVSIVESESLTWSRWYSVCRRAALAFTGKWRMCEGVLLTHNAQCGAYKFTVNRGLKHIVVGHTSNVGLEVEAEFFPELGLVLITVSQS